MRNNEQELCLNSQVAKEGVHPQVRVEVESLSWLRDTLELTNVLMRYSRDWLDWVSMRRHHLSYERCALTTLYLNSNKEKPTHQILRSTRGSAFFKTWALATSPMWTKDDTFLKEMTHPLPRNPMPPFLSQPDKDYIDLGFNDWPHDPCDTQWRMAHLNFRMTCYLQKFS